MKSILNNISFNSTDNTTTTANNNPPNKHQYVSFLFVLFYFTQCIACQLSFHYIKPFNILQSIAFSCKTCLHCSTDSGNGDCRFHLIPGPKRKKPHNYFEVLMGPAAHFKLNIVYIEKTTRSQKKKIIILERKKLNLKTDNPFLFIYLFTLL